MLPRICLLHANRYDKHGQPHVCIDEYMKRHLEIKLISSIVTRAETV